MVSIKTINSGLPLPAIAFSTERGVAGTAAGPYAGFNCCHYVGDDQVHVAECRRQLAGMLGIGVDRLVIPRQTHSLNVAVIDSLPAGELDDVDALVTRLEGVALCINTADCVPVVLCDPEARVIGVAHSGWRGTVGGIAAATLEAMETLGAEASRVKAWIGPSICVDCFEVGEEVAARFAPRFVARRHEWPRPHVDLQSAVAATLEEAGVSRQSITHAVECSRCNPTRLFSARKEGIASGRTLTVAMLSNC